jgi:hypothetical protein
MREIEKTARPVATVTNLPAPATIYEDGVAEVAVPDVP